MQEQEIEIKNVMIKVWMWQRLWKARGDDRVRIMLNSFESALEYYQIPHNHMYWLCPKPNLVLVDRKHLGDRK